MKASLVEFISSSILALSKGQKNEILYPAEGFEDEDKEEEEGVAMSDEAVMAEVAILVASAIEDIKSSIVWAADMAWAGRDIGKWEQLERKNNEMLFRASLIRFDKKRIWVE